MRRRDRIAAIVRMGGVVALLASGLLLPGAVAMAQDGSPVPDAASASVGPGVDRAVVDGSTADGGAADGSATASVAVLVTLISGVDLGTGTYDATFYLGMACDAPCETDGAWEVLNATSLESSLVTDEPGGRWWRVMARLVFVPELRRYPFDVQSLPIVVELVNDPSTRLRLVPDLASSAVDAELGVAGWTMGTPTFTSRKHVYEAVGQAYDQVTFTIPLERDGLASILKYFIALAIFVLLGVATLVLARNDYHIRVGGTALVGLTVFYLATSADVASIGYFTLWDAAVVLAYGCLFLVLVCGIWGAWLFHEGKFEGPDGAARSKRMRLRFIALISVLFIGGIGAILTIGLGR